MLSAEDIAFLKTVTQILEPQFAFIFEHLVIYNLIINLNNKNIKYMCSVVEYYLTYTGSLVWVLELQYIWEM